MLPALWPSVKPDLAPPNDRESVSHGRAPAESPALGVATGTDRRVSVSPWPLHATGAALRAIETPLQAIDARAMPAMDSPLGAIDAPRVVEPASQATPSRDPGRSRWRARIGLVVVGILALAASAVLHLATARGRLAARDAIVAGMNSRIRGTASIDALTRFDLGGIEFAGFRVTAPSGTVVLEVDRMAAELALLEGLSTGRVLLRPCTLEGGTIRLTRGPRDQIDLIHAFEVPADRAMPVMELRGIRMRNVAISLDLPGAPSARMADVSGLAAMSIGHTFALRMDRVRGYVDLPALHVGFDRFSGRLRSDTREPLRVTMVLDLAVVHPGLRIRYLAPRVVGEDGEPGLSIDLGVDVDEEH